MVVVVVVVVMRCALCTVPITIWTNGMMSVTSNVNNMIWYDNYGMVWLSYEMMVVIGQSTLLVTMLCAWFFPWCRLWVRINERGSVVVEIWRLGVFLIFFFFLAWSPFFSFFPWDGCASWNCFLLPWLHEIMINALSCNLSLPEEWMQYYYPSHNSWNNNHLSIHLAS